MGLRKIGGFRYVRDSKTWGFPSLMGFVASIIQGLGFGVYSEKHSEDALTMNLVYSRIP